MLDPHTPQWSTENKHQSFIITKSWNHALYKLWKRIIIFHCKTGKKVWKTRHTKIKTILSRQEEEARLREQEHDSDEETQEESEEEEEEGEEESEEEGEEGEEEQSPGYSLRKSRTKTIRYEAPEVKPGNVNSI